MNGVAREEWGFEGFFVSDCGAIGDPAFQNWNNQVNNGDPLMLAKQALEGGCDTECGSWYIQYLSDAVEKGVVDEGYVDRASERHYTKYFELGVLSDDVYYTTYGPELVDSEEHRALAQSAAEQAIVLLKNDGGILPLDSSKKIAAIGPHANATQDMLSIYRGTNTLVNSHSPYQVMMKMGASVTYAQGCDISCGSTDGFGDAVAAAKAADIAVVFVGLHPGQGDTPAREDEGWDRAQIALPGNQSALVQAIFATGTTTVVVMINGGPLDITWTKANVPAIVESFYPGEMGGDALYRVLFGKVSPSGKLPYTIYDSSIVKAREIGDMSLTNDGGITYRYYQGAPLWWFGDGLSYTTFTYEWYPNNETQSQIIRTEKMASRFGKKKYGDESYKDPVSYRVKVTNTGSYDGDCVVLGFITSDDPDAPQKKLFDFQRAFVAMGQSVNVTLSISPEVCFAFAFLKLLRPSTCLGHISYR